MSYREFLGEAGIDSEAMVAVSCPNRFLVPGPAQPILLPADTVHLLLVDNQPLIFY
jgi:hypothetical protein